MSHALIPYRIEPPATPALQADLSLVDSLAVDSLPVDSLPVDSLAVEVVATPQQEPLPFQTLTDYLATTEIETPYRDVTPEELFGYTSLQAEIPFLGARADEPTATTSFSLLVLAILAFYCLMLYQHLSDAGLLISRISRERASGERLSEDSNGGYSHFLSLCTTLGILLLGVATIRYSAPLLSYTPLAAWPQSGAFWGAIGVAVALFGVILYQFIVAGVVGRLTYTQHLFEQLFLLKRTFFALITLIATPFLALWLLTPAGEGKIWFWVIIIELVVSLILYLQETLSLFISKKISILHWFLYLCGVEIFPISLLILLTVR